MIYPGMYKVENEKAIYTPVAGLTIKEAITNAIEIAQLEKKPVELYMNDIMVTVNKNSNPSLIAARYFSKLERKYTKEAFNKQAQR